MKRILPYTHPVNSPYEHATSTLLAKAKCCGYCTVYDLIPKNFLEKDAAILLRLLPVIWQVPLLHMHILIQMPVYKIMLTHTQNTFPLEACGLLAGQDKSISHIYFIENILHSPVAFEMNAQQQIEAMLNAEDQGLELLAAYHSHPQGPQTPSETDIAKAYYPEIAQIIVSNYIRSSPSVRAFTIVDELVTEIQLCMEL